jgi:nucleoside-triphosphatase THEP1
LETGKLDLEPMEITDAFLSDKEQKSFLLSGGPGSGKTSGLKQIAMKLKENSPTSWVAYINLRKIIETFKENPNMFCENSVKISKYFAEKVLELEKFESKVFQELFRSDRLIFLLDAIDRININFKEITEMLVIKIRELSNNQLYIACRHQSTGELEQKLSAKAFKLANFTDSDLVDFLSNSHPEIRVKRSRNG